MLSTNFKDIPRRSGMLRFYYVCVFIFYSKMTSAPVKVLKGLLSEERVRKVFSTCSYKPVFSKR